MTALPVPTTLDAAADPVPHAPTRLQRLTAHRRIAVGGGVLLAMLVLCVGTMPWTASLRSATFPGRDLFYDLQHTQAAHAPHLWPTWMLMGTTKLGQSLLGRCLLGGVISLAVGVLAAAVSVAIGVTVGILAGYYGGWVDTVLMRVVDVLYGLPYILMVVLLKIALEKPLRATIDTVLGGDSAYSFAAANLGVMFLAIGLVSWLTMARVIRGQVLGLRQMPFVDAAHAVGAPARRIFVRHLLPNLIGPITVYATLTVPSAILQESTLSFLGIGIQPPLPTWGSLASEGMSLALNPVDSKWWLLAFPCLLLALTLLALNYLGDGLRDLFDPKRRAAFV